MTGPAPNALAGGALPPDATAGALLGAARKASGLSIDAVAQQLKLAPRQVRALEEGDYSHLPGRTFVRGFIRSYSRLVRLDPEQVLGALAAGTATSALDAPTLQATAPTMGELPTSERSKAGWTRWAIPITLAAVVAAAAVYEWARPAGVVPAAAPVAIATENPGKVSTVPDPSATSLPNPVAATAPIAEPSTAPESARTVAASPHAVTAASATTAAQATAGGDMVTLTFKDYSWTEIRDRNGRVILFGMNRGGTTQSVSGTSPLDLVIGNATDVLLTFRGKPVDLVPHTRQNVARLKLP